MEVEQKWTIIFVLKVQHKIVLLPRFFSTRYTKKTLPQFRDFRLHLSEHNENSLEGGRLAPFFK